MVKFKRFFASFVLISLFIASSVFAVDTHRIWYASSLTGGGTGALDGVVSGVSIGPYDAAFVVSSDLRFYFYKATFTSEPENDPYTIRPDDVGGGVTSWQASRLDTPNYNVTSGTTLSGSTLYASYIGNYGATSAVTYYIVSAIEGMSFNISLDQDRSSGSTIWVLLYPGDTIINNPNFLAGNAGGVSSYYLSGVTGEDNVTFVAVASGVWKTFESGTPEYKTYD